jgi:hypothetical protein
MKIYVVYADFADCDGHQDPPEGVYSSLELAKAAIDKWDGHRLEIAEMELDAPIMTTPVRTR